MAVGILANQSIRDAAIYVDSGTHIDNYVLAANTAETITKPTGGSYAVFSGTGNFWVAYGRTAVVPAADDTTGANSELNPVVRDVRSAASISIISESNIKVSVAWFR